MSHERTKKKPTQSLQISGVSVDLLAKLEALGAEQRPPLNRNVLILYVLEELAAGRVPTLAFPLEARKEAA
jgi:hypothetical protein